MFKCRGISFFFFFIEKNSLSTWSSDLGKGRDTTLEFPRIFHNPRDIRSRQGRKFSSEIMCGCCTWSLFRDFPSEVERERENSPRRGGARIFSSIIRNFRD